MAQNGTFLTPRKATFALALLSERDTLAAAQRAGVSERTARRWARDPDVQAALAQAEGAALQQAVRDLVRLAGVAVQTLNDAMTDGDATTAARVRAADVVLARLLQLRDLVDTERRLQALEEAQREREREHDTRH